MVRYYGGAFKTYTTQDGLPDNRIVRIDEDGDGTVWVYTRGGLAQWRDGQLQPVASFNEYLVTPKNVGGDAIFFGLWRQHAQGWERFAQGRWSPLPLPPQISDPAQLRIGAIVEDAQRRLWYHLKEACRRIRSVLFTKTRRACCGSARLMAD